jgi:hypothetical protein
MVIRVRCTVTLGDMPACGNVSRIIALVNEGVNVVRLRQNIVGVVLTLAAQFAIGRIDLDGFNPDNTPAGLSFVVTAGVLVIIATPRMSRVSAAGLAGGAVLFYLLAKTWIVEPPSGLYNAWVIATAIEALLVAATVLFAQQITRRMNEFEDAVANITVGEMTRVKSIDTVAEDISIEMSRARRHERPLTVTVLTVDPEVMQGSLHQIVQAVQRSMLERYVLSGIARLAAQKSRRGDIIVQDQANNRVIILSPEASPEQIESLAGRLRSTAYRSLGLPVRYGCAGFPEQALTFDDLVDEATRQAQRSSKDPVRVQSLQGSGQTRQRIRTAKDETSGFDGYSPTLLDISDTSKTHLDD